MHFDLDGKRRGDGGEAVDITIKYSTAHFGAVTDRARYGDHSASSDIASSAHQINEINKIRLAYIKPTGNDEKCKLLFANKPIFWCGIPVFFSGFETEYGLIYVTACADSDYLSDKVLRASFLLSESDSPAVSIAVSGSGAALRIRAVRFDGGGMNADKAVSLAALAALGLL